MFPLSVSRLFSAVRLSRMAILSGEWVEAPTEAMLIGQYVHAWNEGQARINSSASTQRMFTKAGTLRVWLSAG